MTETLVDKHEGPLHADSIEQAYQLVSREAFLQASRDLAQRLAAPQALLLSAAQRGMWIGGKIGPRDATFNLAEYSEILGAVNVPLFMTALQQVAAEAETWRVQIVDGDSGPMQRLSAVSAQQLPFVDVSAEADPQAVAERWMLEELQRPVDPACDPLWCCALFKAAEDRYFWYHRSHHIVLDGFGAGLLSRRLAQIYNALLSNEDAGPTPFLGLQHQLDYESDYRRSSRFHRDREYWLTQLADLPEPISLASGNGRRGGGLRRSSATLSPADGEALRRLGSTSGGSLPQVLIAVMAMYIYRSTGAEDLVFGMPVSARANKTVRSIPGMMANAVAIRLQMRAEMTLAELIGQVAKVVRSALRHQQYRYEDVRRDLGLLAKGQQISWVGVNIEPFDYDLRLGGHPCLTHNMSNGTIEDLTFFVYDRGVNQGLRIDLDANPGLYSQQELDQHRQRLLRMMASILAAPEQAIGQVELLAPGERQQLLYDWNNTAAPLPAVSWPSLFATQVAATPQAVALITAQETLSYAQLNARANRLAHALLAAGMGADDVVAVALPRDASLVVALLAVMKSGAAYLPLDPALPAGRLAMILQEARPQLVLSSEAIASLLPQTAPLILVEQAEASSLEEHNPPPPAGHLARPAYVIYTSGSTGRPKGVVISHGSLMNFLLAMQESLELDSGERMLALTTISFDIAALELYLPLMRGASVVLCERDTARDPAALAAHILRHKVTVMQATPSHWQALLQDHAESLRGLRPLVGGEALPASLAQRLRSLGRPVINLYGPTETTVWSTMLTLEGDDFNAPPIGRPIRNTQCYVLDCSGQPLPVGAVGELFIGGAGVAQGYLHRPALSAERFLPNPFAPGRMYKTGDLARWREDGMLEFLGRNDFQIKIRGFRIEAEEVESQLQACDGVHQAVVSLRKDPAGEPRLVAHVLPSCQGAQAQDAPQAAAAAPRQSLDAAALRQALAAQLPDYMIPAVFVVLDELPLNVNGKLDRKALPEPQWLKRSEYFPPRNELETRLAALWEDIFQRPKISIHDSFFDLGGDSLMAARMIGQLREIMARPVPLAAIFEAATIAELAQQLQQQAAAGDPLATLLPLRSGGSLAPLFCVHPVVGLGWGYAGLSRHLDPQRPLYALQARGLKGEAEQANSIEALAADYLQEIRAVQGSGPYHLLGWSLGGVIAYEMARQLHAGGESVASLTILDAYPFVQREAEQGGDSDGQKQAWLVRSALDFLNFDRSALPQVPETMADLTEFLCREYDVFNLPVVQELQQADADILQRVRGVIEHNLSLLRGYSPGHLKADMLFFQASHNAGTKLEPLLHHRPEAWSFKLDGELTVHSLACDHQQMLDANTLEIVGPLVNAQLGGAAVRRA